MDVSIEKYGKTKLVCATSVQTEFLALLRFPAFVRASYYVFDARQANAERLERVAKIAPNGKVEIPLSTVDLGSVHLAWVRGVFAGCFVLGCLLIFPGYMLATGQPFNHMARFFSLVLAIFLVIGSVGGAMTYWLKFDFEREYRIRKFCGEIIPICADPAMIDLVSAENISLFVDDYCGQLENTTRRDELLFQLVRIRIAVALSERDASRDTDTDRVLFALEQLESHGK